MSHELPQFSCVVYILTTSVKDEEQFRVSWPPRDSQQLSTQSFCQAAPAQGGQQHQPEPVLPAMIGSHYSQGT